MNAKEQHSGVDVVHRCFPEGGDSILTSSLGSPCREAAGLLTGLLIGQSHMISQDVRTCYNIMAMYTRSSGLVRVVNGNHLLLSLMQDQGCR